MKTEFYLLNVSFRYREGTVLEELERKIILLSNDYTFIRDSGEKIYKHDSIYDEEILPRTPLYEYLYSPKEGSLFNRDVRKYLAKIIDRSLSTDFSAQEIVELLDAHNENNIYGLICLHHIDDIQKKYLVYSKNDWFIFHRYFLGLYPASTSNFYSELKKYFIGLYFHENVEHSLRQLEGGLSAFSKTIVKCLGYLNDLFPEYYSPDSGPKNLPGILKAFSSDCKIKTTLEGDAGRKEALSFEFEYKKDKEKFEEQICCEPHMKLEKSDNYPGDSKFYFNRIYFHPGIPHLFNGGILVCHIGKHL